MTATTLRAEDGRPAVRVERRLAHPVEKVWRALTEPSHLNRWFPFDVEADLKVGGTVRFVEKEGGSTLGGVITDLEPPRLIAYSWETDHLRWELRPEDGGCVLVLVHTVDDRYGMASFATGWQACLDGMEQVLAGRPVTAGGDPAAMDAVHERFVAELGLDRATVTETGDGWRLRYERQLVRPDSVAWPALVGDGAPAAGGPVPAGCVPAGLAAGAVTEVTPSRALEYDWLDGGRAAGRVRWELGTGTGHGARLVLTQTGPSDATPPLDGWHEHIERFASALTAAQRT
ncbi:SRPBCC family protein [Pseudonocardia acaciae]|uniref:SRPBCC family protein n=1 Tax=Pseudonocardia acaciae TaxID=551276 RepID=UPI00048BF9C2|nr:SRPBCC family protein [Pseudonocardia acaciae]